MFCGQFESKWRNFWEIMDALPFILMKKETIGLLSALS